MVKITTIPPELLSTIAEAATLGDVLQLRLVCKYFSETLTAIAFRHIVIDTRGLSAEEGCRIDALKTLAEVEERHPVRYLARKLEVRSFQLNPDLKIEALNCFTTVCRNLTRVESLVWSWGSLDSYRSVSLKDSTPIVQALQPMIPSLREVELLAFRVDQIPLLDGLSLLTRLTIKPHSFTPDEVTDPVWKLVTGDEKSWPSIQDVLSNGCESPSLPKLRSLSLNAALAMRSKTKTLPQISSLQSLSLRLGDIGWPQGENNLFIALRQSGILLQQVIAPASAPLFDYLTSYEGILREVQIEGSWELISETSEALMGQASRFFQDVIPKHRSSLRKIEIVTSYDDGWA
ncbi:hypothetical protein BKA70DRAFT_1424876 [Coprinopsis sp. MPI-PUGE-AT-0042]|nr:hypothetical protein BKA70DRAFT_1424876 [Coprinopsis sp. MPI-PUGE-AT-0042]